MFACDEVLSVRRPCGIRNVALLLLADLSKIGSVNPRCPHVGESIAIGRERDAPSVRREPWLMFVRGATEYQLRCASVDWDRVDVADEIERDCLSVGRNVEVDPRPFGYVI